MGGPDRLVCPRCGSYSVIRHEVPETTIAGVRVKQTVFTCQRCDRTWNSVEEVVPTSLGEHIRRAHGGR